MKPFLKLALGASLICVTPLTFSLSAQPAYAAENAVQRAGRAAIVAQYRKGDNAVIKYDVATIMTIMASDYKNYDTDGSVLNRAQAEASLRKTLRSEVNGIAIKFIKSETKILSIQWRGPDAIVMAQTTMVGTARANNQSGRIEVVGVSRDYWGKTKQGWQIRQSVARSMKRWTNGKRDPSI